MGLACILVQSNLPAATILGVRRVVVSEADHRAAIASASGYLPYYAESMFPKIEMDEHRADRQQIEARIVELEKQLANYAKKPE